MRYRPLVEAARDLIPPGVAGLVEPRYLIGVSPHFVGLHHSRMEDAFPDLAARGNSYEACAHACYSFHTPDGRPTIVMPQPHLYHDPVATLLHEHGHLFDEATGFHIAAPETTRYSRTNRQEAFAEAFEIVLLPPSGAWELYVESEAMRPLRAAMHV